MTGARAKVLFDFDGTLAYRPGMWSGCLLDVLDELAPGHGLDPGPLVGGPRTTLPTGLCRYRARSDHRLRRSGRPGPLLRSGPLSSLPRHHRGSHRSPSGRLGTGHRLQPCSRIGRHRRRSRPRFSHRRGLLLGRHRLREAPPRSLRPRASGNRSRRLFHGGGQRRGRRPRSRAGRTPGRSRSPARAFTRRSPLGARPDRRRPPDSQ